MSTKKHTKTAHKPRKPSGGAMGQPGHENGLWGLWCPRWRVVEWRSQWSMGPFSVPKNFFQLFFNQHVNIAKNAIKYHPCQARCEAETGERK